jgi:hypothetical protein
MSVIRSFVLAAIISAGFAAPAFARDPVFTVKLEAPVSEATRVIAQNAIWNCTGDTCVARPSHAVTVRACRQFVREAGGVRVTSYGPEGSELNAEEIARCTGDSAPLQAQNAQ